MSPPERIKPRSELAFSSVDNWCGRCGYLTKPEEDRVQVVYGTTLRYDHADDVCPAKRAEENTRNARFAR